MCWNTTAEKESYEALWLYTKPPYISPVETITGSIHLKSHIRASKHLNNKNLYARCTTTIHHFLADLHESNFPVEVGSNKDGQLCIAFYPRQTDMVFDLTEVGGTISISGWKNKNIRVRQYITADPLNKGTLEELYAFWINSNHGVLLPGKEIMDMIKFVLTGLAMLILGYFLGLQDVFHFK